jgi:plasmid stabilization system protein ParE
LAERELNDAIQYFEHEQPGLGAAFLVEVRRCTSAITEHPEAGAAVLGRIRRRLCQRFPYGLLYTVSGQEIRVLAVMNLRRRPGYWVGRT